MHPPLVIVVFATIGAFMAVMYMLMIWQVNRTGLVQRVPYFGRGRSQFDRLFQSHRMLFPNSDLMFLYKTLQKLQVVVIFMFLVQLGVMLWTSKTVPRNINQELQRTR